MASYILQFMPERFFAIETGGAIMKLTASAQYQPVHKCDATKAASLFLSPAHNKNTKQIID